MAKKVEAMKMAVATGKPFAPIGVLIGFQIASLEEGHAVIELRATDRHSNPMGTLHGGVLCDIADAARGISFASTLEEDESFTTLELKINFLKPVWNDTLRATGKVVKRGRYIGMVECDVTNAKGDLVARSTSTCMVLRGEQASGR
ncbi:MAG: PaaI family thioesterase [Candidatus Acidiferrales bacterium]